MQNFSFTPPRYTYNDYKNWKEDWELVNGYPFQLLPSASPKHSNILGKLIYQANGFFLNNSNNCNCRCFPELDWKINEETVVRPDIMIVCGDPKNEFLEFPPVLVIEILSPHNLKTDRVIKFELYRENGVQFYLMVDPIKEKIEIFELLDNTYKQVEKNTFKLDKNFEISINFDAIWK